MFDKLKNKIASNAIAQKASEITPEESAELENDIIFNESFNEDVDEIIASDELTNTGDLIPQGEIDKEVAPGEIEVKIEGDVAVETIGDKPLEECSTETGDLVVNKENPIEAPEEVKIKYETAEEAESEENKE